MSVERRLRNLKWRLEAENLWLRDLLKPPDFLPAIFLLTAKEERLFTALLSRNRWTRVDLLRSLYGSASEGDAPMSAVIDVCIFHLRRKLKPLGIEIETLSRFGYRIAPEMKKRVSAICKAEKLREEAEAAAIYRNIDAANVSFQFANTVYYELRER